VTEHTPGRPDDLAVGSLVAGYRLDGRIGRGGMAVVFRAYDHRLDRLVALKVLSPELASDAAFRQRFIRESRAAAAVDDPHIIPVFEAGESEGVLFIAMRFVRGGDVGSLVDRVGPLPAARAAEIIAQTASALDAAHAIGLVHRDVKPANMLLDGSPSHDRPDHVYLSDFGLSKASLAVTGLTASGQFLGTLNYIAPEQIEGRPVDGRTDQYALACATFELLCGQPPFSREDGVQVIYAQLHEQPPSLRRRRPELPAEVDDVIATALAKSPDDRYPSCGDFAAALRTALGLGTAGADSGPLRPHPATELAMPAVADEPGAGEPSAEAAARGAGIAAAAPAQPFAPVDPSRGRPSAPAGEETQTAEPSSGPQLPQATRPAAGAAAPGGDTRRGLTEPMGAGRSANGSTASDDFDSPGPPGAPRRSWWRSPLAIGLLVVAALAIGGAIAAATSGHGKGGGHGTSVLRTVSLPGCTTATAKAPTLSGVASATTVTGGSPFGVAVTPDGQYTFVTVGNAVEVLRNTGSLTPTLVQTIAASGADKGDSFTSDGKYLVAAANSGAVVINVAQAVQGAPDPIAGWLTSPSGKGAVEVLISADNEFAFVTLQGSAEMAVFNLRAALTQGFSAADFIGYVPLGNQPVGMASDGTFIYVTNLGGTLSVVSAKEAETTPTSAVVTTLNDGCGSARALLSANNKVLWVTARQSDALLAFDTARLVSDPQHALIGKVMVGEVPLGEIFVDHGTRIVIADSNLNGLRTATSNLAVVDTAAVLDGKPALLGYVPTGLLPRQLAVAGDGSTLLVTDQNSHELQAVRVADLP